MLPFRRVVLGLLALPGFARALTQEYCSSENTGSSYSAVSNIYQSNGACHDQCSGYAFAIVQYQDCWCSNYAPADQQSVSDCDEDCPGYPSDKCGNKDQGLYGYIALSKSPSGTQGGSSSSPSSTSTTQATSTSTYSQPVSTSSDPPSSVTSSQAPTTASSSTASSIYSSSSTASSVPSSSFATTTSTSSTSVLTSYVQSSSTESSTQQTSTYSTPATSSSSITPTTSSTSETPSTTSTSSSSSSTSSTSSSTTAAVVVPVTTSSASSSSLTHSATASPVTSVQVITVSGAVVTQTVTSTPEVASDSATSSLTAQRKGLSGGAIAGAVIGSLLGVAALAFGAFLLWRRKQQSQDGEQAGPGPLRRSPRRNTSVLSKTGLLGRTASMTEREIDEPIYLNTATGNNSVRQSMLFGSTSAAEGVSPVSPLGGNQDNENRRHSRPMVYDQRLNPSVLFANHDNGSRISMQDNNDYSRPLGVANPDLRASFESRMSRT